LDAARSRWAQVSAERPEVAPALPLHRALLTRQIEVLEALPDALAAPPAGVVEDACRAMAAGIPAFRAVSAPAALSSCAAWLEGFTAVLATGGAGPAASKVGAALVSGGIDPLGLLLASWHRDPDEVSALARQAGLNLQVPWLVAELASAPLAVRWQEALLGTSEQARDAVARWDRGDCPACGAWPSLAEYFLGERLNRCAYCAAAWPLSTVRCTYCAESGDDFRTVVANREHPGRRLELCRTCGGYLKTIDVGRPIPFPLLAIEDLASQDLDRAAQSHGFRRVPLGRRR